MKGRLLSVQEASELVKTGAALLVAGDESVLAQLPAGNWIGGTIPYFMTETGGVVSQDKVFVDVLGDAVEETRISLIAEKDLHTLASGGFEDGFTVVILPFGSDAHLRYAREAPNFPGLFDRPVVGWIAGTHLAQADTHPAVYAGPSLAASSESAVVMHARLKDGLSARLDLVNLMQPGAGDDLVFSSTGFTQTTVSVNGVEKNFADYLKSVDFDVRLPLVADYFGAMINVSVREIVPGDKVELYAPVFENVVYRVAAPIGDYVASFEKHVPAEVESASFACNCILNYLYSELEGRKTGEIYGPITFGEIAYQLVNQTLVYLVIE